MSCSSIFLVKCNTSCGMFALPPLPFALEARFPVPFGGGAVNTEAQQPEFPYNVRIETSSGQSASVPIAFLTRQQVESFVQFDFKRLVEEAGIKGARIHVERATTADYDKVLGDVAACLKTASSKVA